MKTKHTIALCLLLAATACSSIQEEPVNTERVKSATDEVFYATLEQSGSADATKVYADENLKVLWNADDRITIYNRYTYGYQYAFQGITGDSAGAFLKKEDDAEFVTGNPLEHIYAVYPYREDNKIDNSGELSITWPSTQFYRANSFGIGANIMVSVTDNNQLRFRNVGGYLALKLYGENISVSSITLRGNDGEPLSGKAKVYNTSLDENPGVAFESVALGSISLECEKPVLIGNSEQSATTFWIVLPPTTFKKGFNITVQTSNGLGFFKSTDSSYTIERNTLCRMEALGISPSDLVSIEEANLQQAEAALAPTYSLVQYMIFGNQRGGSEHNWMLFGLGLDTISTTGANTQFSNWGSMTSDSGYARHYCKYMYKLAYLANTVVDLIDEQPAGPATEALRNKLRAEAVFLRAWAFRVIAGMFGQVVYSEHADSYPQSSYSFNQPMIKREEAWERIVADFEYAEENLPTTPRMLGTVTKAAAAHYLAETYLALGEFAKAEQAASRVINKTDGDYQIMTTRFGNRADQAVDRYGNSLAAPQGAYWDLFRTSGMTNVGDFAAESNPNAPDNKEAIWVAQIDYQSGDSWWRIQRPVLESTFAPWVPMGGKNVQRKGSDGKHYYVFTADAVCFPVGVAPAGAGDPPATVDGEDLGGRKLAYPLSTKMDSLACRTQGNGAAIGLGLLPSEWVARPAGDILGSYWDDPNDFRGSEIMVQRDYYTPSGKKWSEIKKQVQARVDAGLYSITAADTVNITPRFWKFSDDRHIFDGGNAYYDTDWYMTRVAETYLLRAEARLAQNNKAGAAEDINVLRNRAGAKPCTAEQVNIDYILDERVRELFGEEQRWVTLSRLSCNPNATYVLECYPVQDATTSNTLYERTRKYGVGYENDDRGRDAYTDALGYTRHRPNINPYNYIFPIPIQIIRDNQDKQFEQNYGYSE